MNSINVNNDETVPPTAGVLSKARRAGMENGWSRALHAVRRAGISSAYRLHLKTAVDEARTSSRQCLTGKRSRLRRRPEFNER